MLFARWTLLVTSAFFMAGCSASAKVTSPDSESIPLSNIRPVSTFSEAGGSDSACAVPFTACGGDLTGSWQVAASCLAPSPSSSVVGSCAGVSFVASDLQSWTGGGPSLVPQFPESAFNRGFVTFNADHSYQSLVEGSIEGTYHFESPCLSVYHAKDCSALGSTLQGMLISVRNYQNVRCAATGNGCDCSYTFVTDLADEGTWQVSGVTLTTASSYAQGTQTAKFCVTDDAALEIGGATGASLFDAHLQSIRLTTTPDASP